jgi:hypothetical protein
MRREGRQRYAALVMAGLLAAGPAAAQKSGGTLHFIIATGL